MMLLDKILIPNFEEIKLFNDKDLYWLYKKYKHEAFLNLMWGNNDKFIQYKKVSQMIKEEILLRCEVESNEM